MSAGCWPRQRRIAYLQKILQGQCLKVHLALDRVQGGIVDRYLDGIGVAINPFHGSNAKKASHRRCRSASNVQAIRDLVGLLAYRNQCLQAKAGGFCCPFRKPFLVQRA